MSNRYFQAVCIASLLFLTALAYWPGLHGPLLYDDIGNLKPLTEWIAGNQTWQWSAFHNGSGPLGRSVSMLSFIANVQLLGAGVWGLKFGNLLIHLANGILVWLLFRALLARDDTLKANGGSAWLPLFGAALWLLHPLLVSTVLYVVQRMAMLSAMSVLVCLLCYFRGRKVVSYGHLRPALLWFPGAGIALLVGLLCKENAIVAVPLCGWLELRLQNKRQPRHWMSKAFIAATLILPIVCVALLAMAGWSQIVDGYVNRPYTLWERLLTQGRVLWDYVAAVLVPQGPRLGLFHDDFVASRSLLDPPTTWLAVIGWLGSLALAWRLRSALPGVLLGLGFFLIGHSLESSIFPLLLYFEHRNYLPAIGLIWAILSLLAGMASRMRKRMERPRLVFAAGALLLVAALATATWMRSQIWSSLDLIHAQALLQHPLSRSLRVDASGQAFRRGDYALAREHLRALESSPSESTRRVAAAARFVVECQTQSPFGPKLREALFGGRPEPLEADLVTALESFSDAAQTNRCPLSAYEAADGLRRLLDRSNLPADNRLLSQVRFKVAQLYDAAGQRDEAIRQAFLAYHDKPYDAPVGLFLADRLIAVGRRDDATKLLWKVSHHIAASDTTNSTILSGLRAAQNADSPTDAP